MIRRTLLLLCIVIVVDTIAWLLPLGKPAGRALAALALTASVLGTWPTLRKLWLL